MTSAESNPSYGSESSASSETGSETAYRLLLLDHHPLGVAYHRGSDEVLLFVPGWRSAPVIARAPLEELGPDHVPPLVREWGHVRWAPNAIRAKGRPDPAGFLFRASLAAERHSFTPLEDSAGKTLGVARRTPASSQRIELTLSEGEVELLEASELDELGEQEVDKLEAKLETSGLRWGHERSWRDALGAEETIAALNGNRDLSLVPAARQYHGVQNPADLAAEIEALKRHAESSRSAAPSATDSPEDASMGDSNSK